MSQPEQSGRKNSLIWSGLAFFLFRPSTGWMRSTHTRPICFIQSINLNVYLIQITITETLRIEFDRIAEHAWPREVDK